MVFCDMIDNPYDLEKFDIIYNLYRRAMFRVAYSITKDKFDAEDVVQISLVKLIGILHRVSRDEVTEPSCKGLLVTITRNAAIDYIRRRKNIPVPVETLRNTGMPSTEDIYIRVEELQTIIKYIGELPENYRDVLRLRVLYQLSAKETASIMCISVANVNTMLGRARKQLLAKLKESRKYPEK